MSGKVVSFINMKGGVGKTTLCIGIGEYLSSFENKKILLIDMDPQFNTTQSIMNFFNLEDKYLSDFRYNKTVVNLFKRRTSITEQNICVKSDDIIINLNNNLSIIPGSIDLILQDNDSSSPRLKTLKNFINSNNLKDKFDFIFIDCPPTISLYTNSAILASDFYIVPIKIDSYSILGVKLLKDVINELMRNEADYGFNIKPIGKIYTMIDNLTEKTNSIIKSIESDKISNEIISFNSRTSFVRDLMVGKQGNISSYYSASRSDIKEISKEFLRRVACS